MSRGEKILIAPGALDCNRGDQALVWEAISCVRKASPGSEVAIMADCHDDPEDPQTRQTRKLRVGVLPMLLPNPRRAAGTDKGEIIDSGWSLVKMMIRAVRDIQQMGLLLLWPGNRRLARWLLGKDRYTTYSFVRDCRAVVVKGGGYIYAYRGLRWNYFIVFGLYPLMFAQRCGVKVVVLPNSFGPFRTRWSRWLARRTLGRCTVLTAREPKSQDLLESLVEGKSQLFPDMAFGLAPADAEWAKAELARWGVSVGEGEYVGVTMRPWRFPNARDPKLMYTRYVQAFARLLEHLVSSGYKPLLFAHVIGPHAHEDDRIALNDVVKVTSAAERVVLEPIPITDFRGSARAEARGSPSQQPGRGSAQAEARGSPGFRDVLLVDGDYDCRQIKALYQFMDYMVCTRLHSAIFSIAQNVPCLVVSYHGYKAPGIMSEIGVGEYCLAIDGVDGESLIRTFEALVANRAEVKRKMAAYMSGCTGRLEDLQRLVTAEIGEHTGQDLERRPC